MAPRAGLDPLGGGAGRGGAVRGGEDGEGGEEVRERC